mmetsp:Transcript_20610/g.42429  ORF Transcript_20610/g.42429 Transcript_20610/m.42429 type:complete len:94 (-) Transcript_20610:932-1213(-)
MIKAARAVEKWRCDEDVIEGSKLGLMRCAPTSMSKSCTSISLSLCIVHRCVRLSKGVYCYIKRTCMMNGAKENTKTEFPPSTPCGVSNRANMD